MPPSNDPVEVPHNYPTAAIFIDESGSRATASSAFVVAAIKVREPGRLARAVRDVRDRTGFDQEFKRELVGVHLDAITTPRGCSLEDTVRGMVNGRLRSTSAVTAVCLDSRTNDLLQVADVVAGSVLHQRRLAAGGSVPKSTSNKGKIAQQLAVLFGRPGLTDGKDARVNIRTYRGPRTRPAGHLLAVGEASAVTG
ncbi:hypothetical protein BJF78_08410 [Pseudonocardia sp. CNS-139]|nr:hypothetical protein BJF78_08410 [Pseudonocardia sp. CNS-139]